MAVPVLHENVEVGLDSKADRVTIVVGTDQNIIQSVIVLKSNFSKKKKKKKYNLLCKKRRDKETKSTSWEIGMLQSTASSPSSNSTKGLRSELHRPDSPIGRRGERDCSGSSRGRDSERDDHSSSRRHSVDMRQSASDHEATKTVVYSNSSAKLSKTRYTFPGEKKFSRSDSCGYVILPPVEETKKEKKYPKSSKSRKSAYERRQNTL